MDVLVYLSIAHIGAAILTTIVIHRLDYFERPQVVGQLLIVWLIPFIGSVSILIFQSVVHRNMTTKTKPETENHYRDEGLAVDLHHEVVSDD